MNNIDQAAILVGGLGTRLGRLTAQTPKPLLPCGDRPFLAWLLAGLAASGVRQVILLAAYRADTIAASLPQLRRLVGRWMEIQMVQEPEPAGTGGALWCARDQLAETFLLCNGDSWFDTDLEQINRAVAHNTPDVIAHMVLRHMPDASRYGVAQLSGERVCGFAARGAPNTPGFINAGLYGLRKTIFDCMAPAETRCSLEQDLLPRWAAEGRVRATLAPQDQFFIDIGVPDDFVRAQTEVPNRFRTRFPDHISD